MSTYSSYDFEESLVYDREQVARVIAAWGESPEGWGSWEGGFLLEMKEPVSEAGQKFVYITGWCDTSGWGCRDGRAEEWFDTEPDLATLRETAGTDGSGWGESIVDPDLWDRDPADLNRYVRGEIKSMDWVTPASEGEG